MKERTPDNELDQSIKRINVTWLLLISEKAGIHEQVSAAEGSKQQHSKPLGKARDCTIEQGGGSHQDLVTGQVHAKGATGSECCYQCLG